MAAAKDLQNYICELLEQVACELNVKEVRFQLSGEEFVYHYDTLQNKTIEFDGWQAASVLFRGDILDDMKTVRNFIKKGLLQRSEANIKVRQPLQSITLTNKNK